MDEGGAHMKSTTTEEYLNSVVKCDHHIQKDLCVTRAKYRQGRKLTAVKVYTVSNESKYLIMQGVPSINLKEEVTNLCSKYGKVHHVSKLDNYPNESFTNTFLIKYKNTASARTAKGKLDNYNYYGGILHVCYAPELETVRETLEKLSYRQFEIMQLLQSYSSVDLNTERMLKRKKSLISMEEAVCMSYKKLRKVRDFAKSLNS